MEVCIQAKTCDERELCSKKIQILFFAVQWKEQSTIGDIRHEPNYVFNFNAPLKQDANGKICITEAFFALFPLSMMEPANRVNIHELEINRYWQSVTPKELVKWFGLFMLCMEHAHGRKRDLWSEDHPNFNV
jgi:hypothetical protein